jgi:hypothetical protein
MAAVDQLHERWFTDHPFLPPRGDLVSEVLAHETLRGFFAV